uniref:RING-type E3 ubiquitin transferase n=1 Tax=Arcella intermedia TaxID=1963864 RepID=A0A6B2LIW9_9EUKA
MEAADPPGDCPICLCELRERIVRLSACNGHEFHEECIVECFDETNVFLKCPICAYIYGIKTGKQPTGTMKVTFLPVGAIPVSGYEQYGTIKIMYHFPSGIQGEEHEMPGCPYYGTARTCYLPDNDEGVEILNLLVIAFKRRLTFTIGTSVKTGKKNAVIWNGIHHKTSPTGGPTKYGYPDETYFKRVKEELALCGVS